MGIELYDHQQSAIEKLKTGAILCGGVGSGKSRTALTYYFCKVCGGKLRINGKGQYMPMSNPRDLYIITTARKRDTDDWIAECAPFLISDVPGLTPSKINLTVDSWNNIKKYVDVKNSFFIFDEQRVVGSGAWVKSFLKITKANEWILLSATPGDSWVDYIPVFIANGFYPNRTAFKRRHCIFNPYTRFEKIEGYREQGRLIKLRNSILIKMDYEKPTVRHRIDLKADYDRLAYRSLLRDRWNPFENQPVVNASELCYCLRRVSNEHESRIELINVVLTEHPKLIIFYNFDYELEMLRSASFVGNPDIAEWNGHRHEPIPKSDCWLYLVQYTAGAEGWNCTETNAIIFFSQNYSYKIMEQSAGRIDRLNTPYKDLYFYHIRSSSSIDIAIARAIAKKKAFNIRGFADSSRF